MKIRKKSLVVLLTGVVLSAASLMGGRLTVENKVPYTQVNMGYMTSGSGLNFQAKTFNMGSGKKSEINYYLTQPGKGRVKLGVFKNLEKLPTEGVYEYTLKNKQLGNKEVKILVTIDRNLCKPGASVCFLKPDGIDTFDMVILDVLIDGVSVSGDKGEL